ncbi:hypothetical protein KP509_19G043200 [Ceratopteris richardii]|uniref:Uncharacterized protein n=1 Tax=Ceratopteris richardii TaxID=49495 RepID=A0A8T2SN36_CERRI|nr:hypothetical protein KP509_19G043200 [Ceratopteris richardii]
MEGGLLEEWLERAVFSSSTPRSFPSRSSSPPAQRISVAWSQVRECARNGILLPQHTTALSLLQEHGRTIHISEPQARSLISILSSISSYASSTDDGIAQAIGSTALLLSIWVRRGFTSVSKDNIKDVIEAIISNTIKALEISTSSHYFINEAILLLGSMCVNSRVGEEHRQRCQALIAQEFVLQRKHIRGIKCKEALAGVGYAMVSSTGPSLKSLVQGLLLLWMDVDAALDHQIEVNISSRPSIENGLLLLHLMEWYGSVALSRGKYASSLYTVVGEIGASVLSGKTPPARYGALFTAAGLLRSFRIYRSAQRPGLDNLELNREEIMASLNHSIIRVIDATVSHRVNEIAAAVEAGSALLLDITIAEKYFADSHLGDQGWLQCVAVALSRCSGVSPNVSVLVCLTTAFVEVVFPLKAFYNEMIAQISEGNGDRLTMHGKSILFHELGAILRVICEQYESANMKWQGWMECTFLWFSEFIYRNHRKYLLLLASRKQESASPLFDGDAGSLKEILEAAIMSAVMFFSRASMKKTYSNDAHAKGQFAAMVMQSLSCLEFIRQAQIPEYKDLVQRCVEWASRTETTSAMLVSMLPTFDEVIHSPGPLVPCYSWKKDDVQDSRVLFGFRVLPSCLQTFPSTFFSSNVAPVMFLYMKHPKQPLVQASHSLLVYFLSVKACDSNRDSIKEKLAIQFVQKTFEDDLGFSNYDSFVTVIGAVARHLPAGSSATKACITSLSRRASESFGSAITRGEEDKLEAAKKLQTLLLHLILIVDVQVLPHLLQEVASLVLGQMSPHRIHALEEAFDVLAGSDDLTRKHILVPWLQSLSYLCSNSNEQRHSAPTDSKKRKRRSPKTRFNSETVEGDGVVAFNATMSTEPKVNNISQVSRSRL